MSSPRAYTAWGTVVGTGAASIEIVLMEATRPLTVLEIEEEVRRRGIPERGAVGRHLTVLKERGHIINTSEGWCRLELCSESSLAGSKPEAKKVLTKVINKTSSPVPSTTLASSHVSETPKERLQNLKLIIEIGVGAVTLIGAIIGLVWKFK
jgi:hypothetical protein